MPVNPNSANSIKLKSSEAERSTWNVFLRRGELTHIVRTVSANQTTENVPRETFGVPLTIHSHNTFQVKHLASLFYLC